MARSSLIRLAVVAALAGTASVARAQTFTNPLDGGADPFAFQWKGMYFYTRTTGASVAVSRAPLLQDIIRNKNDSSVNFEVWKPPAGTAYSSEIWAPEIHRLNGKWYLYVAADNGNDANHRMYVLEGDSQDPQGTYTMKGQITLPSAVNRWAIDGTVLEQNGKNYFVWSGRSNTGATDTTSNQSLWIAEMSNPWTLSGNRTAISSPTLAWERNGHPVNEGPEVLRHGDDVYMTYSASNFQTDQYALGALKLKAGADPMLASSWVKQSQPIFSQGNGVVSTGHASFVKSPDGSEDWIVYHGRLATGDARKLMIQKFTWPGDGTVNIGKPLAPNLPIAAPSGMPLVTYVANGSFNRKDLGTANSAAGIQSFKTTGAVGVVANGKGYTFITGGDGPQSGYMTVATLPAIWQDIGPIHQGTWSFSAGLAISDNQTFQADNNEATFAVTLESVGLYPDGSANEFDVVELARRTFSSDELNTSAFSYFDVSAIVADAARVGTLLRIGLETTGIENATSNGWNVKLSNFTVDYSAIVPEPATIALLMCAFPIIARRR